MKYTLLITFFSLAITLLADEPTPAFEPYDLSDIGRVVAHDSGFYHVLEADGQVHGYRAPGGICDAGQAAAHILAERANPTPPPAAAVPTWHDATLDITLRIDADDQAKFTADVTGYSAKALAGDLDLDVETAVIRDAAGAEHTLTIRNYLRLIGRLHAALRAQWEAAP